MRYRHVLKRTDEQQTFDDLETKFSLFFLSRGISIFLIVMGKRIQKRSQDRDTANNARDSHKAPRADVLLVASWPPSMISDEVSMLLLRRYRLGFCFFDLFAYFICFPPRPVFRDSNCLPENYFDAVVVLWMNSPSWGRGVTQREISSRREIPLR